MTQHLTHRCRWEPERTWVFIVGTLSWKHADLFSSFPKANRCDAILANVYRERGVPEAQIVYLQDKQATTAGIQRALETHLDKARTNDLLILYYCGHGGKNDDAIAYFASYDTDCDVNQGWIVDTIPATIARCFRGSTALLLADCCYSGSLAEAVAQQPGRIAYACLASSLASELSTGNWTFTEGLIAGLRGQAFVDDDGSHTITLQELAGQIIDSMAFAEEQIATFAVSDGFDPQLVLASAKPRPDPRVGQRVEVQSENKWYPAQIIDANGEQLRVHYYGYEDSDDEWVTSERTREAVRKTYPIGTAVEVKSRNKWYSAKVLDVRSGIHSIQYDDYGPEWNEWVALKRIRVPK